MKGGIFFRRRRHTWELYPSVIQWTSTNYVLPSLSSDHPLVPNKSGPDDTLLGRSHPLLSRVREGSRECQVRTGTRSLEKLVRTDPGPWSPTFGRSGVRTVGAGSGGASTGG